MAYTITTQKLVDGPRNLVVKVDGVSDTVGTDTSGVVIINPLDSTSQFQANKVRIDRIVYTVEEGINVFLQWDATSPVRIIDLVKAGHGEYKRFGGLQNNADSTATGKVLLGVQGTTVGATQEFTLIIEAVKQSLV